MNSETPEPPRLSEAECLALLRRMFPTGLSGADVVAELAPDGWDASPLVRAHHPSLEQWHAERVALARRLAEMGKILGRNRPEKDQPQREPSAKPEPALEDSRREFRETLVDGAAECTELVGAACWEIFSNNHSVIVPDGREAHLGSWRGSSAFLDAFACGETDPEVLGDAGDEMRFYMGFVWIRERCDYGPVHRTVFRRLQREGCDWIFSFPQVQFVRVDRRDDADAADDAKPPHEYDPSSAFAGEQEQVEADAERARLDAEMARIHDEAREKARSEPAPPVVAAYRAIFGRWPDGWPP